jgi:ATP-dependent helicase HrpB
MIPLPIDTLKDKILESLAKSPFLVLSAPTGSGKSTRVPQFLAGSPWPGTIYVLEPRVLATRLLAERVAHEVGCPVGEVVGYRTRHDSRFRRDSRIVFITQGLFVRLMQENPSLEGMACVILDEFHERTIHGDLVLGHLRNTLVPGSPKRAVVMSATMDSERVSRWLSCPSLETHGRTYPVTLQYSGLPEQQRETPLWEHAAAGVRRLLSEGIRGDGLVFMPGMHEIRRTIQAIERSSLSEAVHCFALHGEMTQGEQNLAFGKSDRRKIIVATNVAETSITMEGVTWVVDAGYARVARYQSARRINTLILERISRQSADQRSGRAGRTAPGVCLRLWSQGTHDRLPPQQDPEVLRVDLAETVLRMKALGFADPAGFPWFDPPEPKALGDATALLTALGALEPSGQLSALGRSMVDWPLHPRLARMALEAGKSGCLGEALKWAAIISEPSFTLRGRFHPQEVRGLRSDLTYLSEALERAHGAGFQPAACDRLGIHGQNARKVVRTWQLFLRQAREESRQDDPFTDDDDSDDEVAAPRETATESALIRSLLVGFPDQVAVKEHSGSLAASLSGKRRGQVADDSMIRHATLFLPAEITEIISGKDRRTVLDMNSELTLEDLRACFPGGLRTDLAAVWNRIDRQVDGEERTSLGDLVIERRRSDALDPAAACALLAEEYLRGSFTLVKWDDSVEKWISKVRWVAHHFPEKKLTTYSDEDRLVLLQEIFDGARSVREIKDRECLQVVKFALSWDDQQFIERMSPESIPLPNGQALRPQYEADGVVTASIKLQRLYDVHVHPTVADGRVKVLLDILAPNQRTVQKTLDLPGFWSGSYPQVRKELAGRYPKHEWR